MNDFGFASSKDSDQPEQLSVFDVYKKKSSLYLATHLVKGSAVAQW